VTLEVHAGEIVGVAGVEGAGPWELLRALSGRLPVQAGRIERPPQVGFVPEDRHRDAVLLDRSLTDNVALRAAGERRGRMPWRELRARTHLLLREYDVRAPSPDSPMRSLSGGNQQKLVVAREMTIATVDEPPAAGGGPAGRAIVVENPTRGLDVRAAAAVHARLRAARDEGAGILLYSSDLDEVLAMADRVAVLHDGALRDVPADRDQVGRALLGLA
jgi:simple sugar transport system ATP-binding protein